MRGITRFRRAAATPPAPRISVVIPVYNTEAHLAACLDSVLTQSLLRLELIAVDDGSTDGSWAILERYAAADPRVQIFRQTNSGQGAARNVGVSHATGEYLTFVDSDDVLPAHALRAQANQLDRTGSDFCVGAVQLRGSDQSQPWWGPIVHERDRPGIRIDDFPEAILDVIACNRVFRRSFWTDRVGGFAGGIAYEDHVPMVAAYVRADRFDVLNRVTYVWQIRPTGDSTSQRKDELKNLEDRIAVKHQARAMLEHEASAPVLDAWLARVLDADLALFIRPALRADDAYRHTLQAALLPYVERATPSVLAQVRLHQKLRCWLASEGDWEAVESLDAYIREWSRVPPTRVLDGRVVVATDLSSVIGREVPAELLALGNHQTPLEVDLVQVRLANEEALEIVGLARIANVDLTGSAPSISLVLHGPGGRRVPVEVATVRHPAATAQAHRVSTPNADYAPGSFTTLIDLNALAVVTGTWTLEFGVGVQGLERSGPARSYLSGSSASPGALVAVPVGEVTVRPTWDPVAGFAVEVAARADQAPGRADGPVVQVTDLRFAGNDVEWQVRYAGVSADEAATLVLAGADSNLPLEVTQEGSGVLRARQLPTYDDGAVLGTGRRHLLITGADATAPTPVTWSDALQGTLQVEHLNAVHQLRFLRGRAGEVTVVHAAPLADDERGPYAQHKLRAWYQQLDPEPEDAVLVQDTDPAARSLLGVLHAELVREHPELAFHWGVRDFATPVPDGATPLLIGSRAWHQKLAAVRTLHLVEDLPLFFHKRAHQRLTRVFGSMQDDPAPIGRSLWIERRYTPGRIAQQLERSHRDWDAVVVPDQVTKEVVRAEFDYEGPVGVRES